MSGTYDEVSDEELFAALNGQPCPPLPELPAHTMLRELIDLLQEDRATAVRLLLRADGEAARLPILDKLIEAEDRAARAVNQFLDEWQPDMRAN